MSLRSPTRPQPTLPPRSTIRRFRAGLPPRHAARGDLRLEACAGAGRGLPRCSSPGASSFRRVAQVLEERLADTGGSWGRKSWPTPFDGGGPCSAGRSFTGAAQGELAAGTLRQDVEAIAHLSKGYGASSDAAGRPEQLEEELALLSGCRWSPFRQPRAIRPRYERDLQPGPGAMRAATRGDRRNCFRYCGGCGTTIWCGASSGGPTDTGRASWDRRSPREQRQFAEACLWPGALLVHRLLYCSDRFGDAMAAKIEGIAMDDAVAAWEDPMPTFCPTWSAPASSADSISGAAPFGFSASPTAPWTSSKLALPFAQRLAHATQPRVRPGLGCGSAQLATRVRSSAGGARRRRSSSRASVSMPQLLAFRDHVRRLCPGRPRVGRWRALSSFVPASPAWGVMGARLFETQWLGFIAEAHVHARQFDDALRCVGSGSKVRRRDGRVPLSG